MKTQSLSQRQQSRSWHAVFLVCFVLAAWLLAGRVQAGAGQTNSPMTPEQMFEGGTNTYNNWIELSVGGLMTSGNAAQAQQRFRLNTGAFGGIQDLHLQQTIATNTTFTLDGRALFDEHDYKLNLDVRREELGFVRVNYENFRTWYNGAGGFFPPTGVQYTLSDDTLTLDRGAVSFEAGLAKKDIPKINFKYTHSYRDGEKSSTTWAPVHPDTVTDPTLVRALSPSFYDLDEKVDTFQLDATHRIKATDFGAGFRYEKADLDDALKETLFPGESVQRKVTDRQETSYDMFSGHAFAETWIKKDLFFSAGFLATDVDNRFSGSRVYGSDFDVGFVANSLNGLGYTNLSGGSHLQDYVLNLSLMATPFTNFTIVPSIRAQKETWDADSSDTGTLGLSSGSFSSTSDRELIDVTERLDMRYKGVVNWVFYGGGEWTEGDGELNENGGLSQINNIGVSPILRSTDDTRFFQKYFIGARWYPVRRLSLDAGGYYKRNEYDYTHAVDSTSNDASSPNRYPAYLVMQDFETYDGNVRLTFRPVRNVNLVTRYEYQWSTIHTKPDPVSDLANVQSSDMTSHIIAQNINWVPWSRLTLQVGFNYVLSTTETPTSEFTQAILDSQNNYWTLNFSAGLVLDDKTDLNVGYFFYQADDYTDNSSAGVPLGTGSEEQSVTATLTRRLSAHMRLNLKYAFTHYTDWASGGNNDFDGHLVYASLQYRF